MLKLEIYFDDEAELEAWWKIRGRDPAVCQDPRFRWGSDGRPGDCLLWSGPMMRSAAPTAFIGDTQVHLRRAAWMAKYGAPRYTGFENTCGTPRCVAPEHTRNTSRRGPNGLAMYKQVRTTEDATG